MSMQEIGEFKYSNWRPAILLILAVIVGLAAVRWYGSAGPEGLPAGQSKWSLSFLQKKKQVAVTAKISGPVDVPKPGDTPKSVETPTSAQPSTNQPVSISSTATGAVMETAATKVVMDEAVALEESKSLAQARKKYLLLLSAPLDDRTREDVERRLGAIDYELVSTPAGIPEKQEYVVQGGDSLDKIARKFGTTVELTQKGNLLSSSVIRAGDRLLVLAGRFAIKINKTRNDMVITLNGQFFARHTVATGKFGKTPVGSFVINDKIKEPVWWRPDGKEIPFGHPENILGTRWMSIKSADPGTPDVKGYGIHGTWDDSSLGKAASAGCIRMKNADVERLFAMVPVGTVVTITEQ